MYHTKMNRDAETHQMVNDAHMGNFDKVKECIEVKGFHPDEVGTNTCTALLCVCCRKESHEFVKYLLDKGANPNIYTADKLSPLKSAAKQKSYENVKLLLDKGADPNYEREGNVALTVACDEGKDDDINLVKLLLPLTDSRWYQKAYEYSSSIKIRNYIQDSNPQLTFTEPLDNVFGGPDYKSKLHYETAPIHPILNELWHLLEDYIKTVKDPNRAMMYVFQKMGISDAPQHYIDMIEKDGDLGMYNDMMLNLKEFIDGNEDLKNKYSKSYKLLSDNIIYSDSEEEDSDN